MNCRVPLSALALLASPVAATAQPGDSVTVSGQWLRVLGQGLPAAGYFKLFNPTGHPVTLTGASSPACGSLSLHRTVHQTPVNGLGGMKGMTGMSSMQAVGAVEVPPHGTLRFAPDGYHLMCEQASSAVQPGRTIRVTLKIEGAQAITSPFTVEAARGR